MNVNDARNYAIPEDAKVVAERIFARQVELEQAYNLIEKRPILVDPPNTREGQVLLKDFFWRVTEELGETLDAKETGESREKVWEELADGLHFVVGLVIHSQCYFIWEEVIQLPRPVLSDSYHYAVTWFVRSAGMLGNTLKLKPWKQTDIATDYKAFEGCLRTFILSYLRVCWSLGMTLPDLYDFYMRKSEVNLFRIRSRY